MKTLTRPPTSPRASALDRDAAMSLATTEYDRLCEVLERLTPAQWATPTECPGWDVRAMAGHCLGMAQMAASVRETVRQQSAAARAARGSQRPMIDELTALQVEKNAALSTAELTAAFRAVSGAAVTGRRRAPAPVRALTLTEEVGGAKEKWRVGFLLDVILTRDPWMHRVDICRATGAELRLTEDHDGVLVADVVREWADRHGRPYDLRLTGVAGGHWRRGDGGDRLEMDAVEFCRTVSGRRAGEGLLATEVPF